MDREAGYDFLVALCDGIESVCDAAERDDPQAFEYDGAQLRYALERALYVTLVNDRQLYSAFASRGRGGPIPALPARDELEAEVVRAMVPGVTLGLPKPPGGLTRARSGRIGRLLGAARPSVRRPPPGVPPAPGSVLFAIDHPKFLRYIRPVVELLPSGSPAILSISPAVTRQIEGGAMPWVGVHGPEQLRPVRRSRLRSRAPVFAHLAAEFQRTRKVLQSLQPACVVVIEGNASTDELVNRAARSLGIPCVCLQQGWAPVIHTGFRNMAYTQMAIWGEGFAELLRPHNPEQRFEVTGSPALVSATDGELARQVAGRRAVGVFLQPPTFLISEDDARALVEIARRVATDNPGAAVLFREHPGEAIGVGDLETLPNVIPAPAESYGLGEVLSASDAVVSIYSTTLIEAAGLGRPPVIFNPTSLPRYVPDLEQLGAGVEVETVDAAVEALSRMLRGEAELRRFEPGTQAVRDRFFDGARGDAPERIAALLRAAAGV